MERLDDVPADGLVLIVQKCVGVALLRRIPCARGVRIAQRLEVGEDIVAGGGDMKTNVAATRGSYTPGGA